MANLTYEFPGNLGDLMGAYDTAHWETVVMQLKPSVGVLKRGAVLSLVAGKLELTVAANQASAYGVLLDSSVDTAAAFSNNSVTGSVARAGSFRGPALIVGVGVDPIALAGVLRDHGIYIEGPITVPTSLEAAEAPEAPVAAQAPHTVSFEA
jgi:hypothetical protein